MTLPAPAQLELLLVGGGHAHVGVIKRFAMHPLPGVRITVVSNVSATPYSGMLPGFIAGHYNYDDAHVELRPLCRAAGVRFYRANVCGLDLPNKRLLLAGRPSVRFDLLSLNIGSTPAQDDVPGVRDYALPVKPVEAFLSGWSTLIERFRATQARPFQVVAVGGGAGGVELLLSIRHRLRRESLSTRGPAPEFHLVSATPTLLANHPPGVQRRIASACQRQGIVVHSAQRVVSVSATTAQTSTGQTLAYDALLWVTQASAPPWPAASGLRVDREGFLAVNACLQSTSHPFVFAAGDIAHVLDHPRPKAGVFAVRQGPPLAANLEAALQGKPLRPFRPQTHFLSLISTGEQSAVASRGSFAWEGRWVWYLKDWIDRRWMRQYQDLTSLPHSMRMRSSAQAHRSIFPPGPAPAAQHWPRCGGCGAKVDANILTRVLDRIRPSRPANVLVGLTAPDDAAVVRWPVGALLVQTVDYLPAFLDDPYVFGQIAATHALGDIYAMGATPTSALVVAILPFAAEPLVEEQLGQLLAGVVEVLTAHQTALIGGHTSEGADSALGITVNGEAAEDTLLRKSGLRRGDRLILTKALGTGVVLAADMRGSAKGRWVDAAVASMLHSPSLALRCLRDHGVTACTDVTGFGLAGHLQEMLRLSTVDAALSLDAIPVLDGAAALAQLGVRSSLQPGNRLAANAVTADTAAQAHPVFPLLFDPQTAGGLLAGVPAERARACVDTLHRLGYVAAQVIGHVTDTQGPAVRIHCETA